MFQFQQVFSRSNRSALAEWWWTVDRALLAAILVLFAFGVALVATASPPVAIRIGVDDAHFITRHIIMSVPAFLVMLCVSILTPQYIRRVGSVILIGGIFLMMIIPFVGAEVKGAQRWISIFGLSLQPSEFVKPAFAIVAAWFMAHQKQYASFRGNIFAAVLYLVCVTLLLIQPDFGMTVVVTAMFAVQIFLAGFPFRYMVMMGLVGAVGLVAAYSTFDHVKSRIDRFMNPESGDTYQVDRSLEAFANGGFFGTGPGQGTVKNSIPDSHADFIFAVAGEEFGLFFTLIMVGLYLFILLRGYNRLMESNDLFAVLAVGGILAMFGLQAFVHMGSSLHILPTKGMTLPFISYGGSSIIAMGLSMGVVLGLTRRQTKSTIARGGLSVSTRRGSL